MPGLMEEFQTLLAEMPGFHAAVEHGMAYASGPEQQLLAELSQTVTEHMELAKEWIPKVNAAFENEIAEVQASIKQTTANLAKLEKEFAEQLEKAKNPPPPPPEPPAPGVGDPSHGRHIADELLALPGDLIDVVIGQLSPLRLHFAFEFVPLAFERVAVHTSPPL